MSDWKPSQEAVLWRLYQGEKNGVQYPCILTKLTGEKPTWVLCDHRGNSTRHRGDDFTPDRIKEIKK